MNRKHEDAIKAACKRNTRSNAKTPRGCAKALVASYKRERQAGIRQAAIQLDDQIDRCVARAQSCQQEFEHYLAALEAGDAEHAEMCLAGATHHHQEAARAHSIGVGVARWLGRNPMPRLFWLRRLVEVACAPKDMRSDYQINLRTVRKQNPEYCRAQVDAAFRKTFLSRIRRERANAWRKACKSLDNMAEYMDGARNRLHRQAELAREYLGEKLPAHDGRASLLYFSPRAAQVQVTWHVPAFALVLADGRLAVRVGKADFYHTAPVGFSWRIDHNGVFLRREFDGMDYHPEAHEIACEAAGERLVEAIDRNARIRREMQEAEERASLRALEANRARALSNLGEAISFAAWAATGGCLTLADSRNAGNCEAGTLAWINRNLGGTKGRRCIPVAALVGRLDALRDDTWRFMAVVKAAYRRDMAALAAGYTVLA